MMPMVADRSILAPLFIGTLVLWFLVEVRQAFRRRVDATPTDRYSLLVLRVCIGIGVVLAALARRAALAPIPAGPSVLVGLGLVLMWTGLGLRWWCFQTLGRYFTFSVMTSADQSVITSGPYRVLRHPSYAGILLIVLGLGLTLGDWLSLAAIMVFIGIGLLNRIRVEEAALSEALGPRYTDFASTRKRLVPYVW